MPHREELFQRLVQVREEFKDLVASYPTKDQVNKDLKKIYKEFDTRINSNHKKLKEQIDSFDEVLAG